MGWLLLENKVCEVGLACLKADSKVSLLIKYLFYRFSSCRFAKKKSSMFERCSLLSKQYDVFPFGFRVLLVCKLQTRFLLICISIDGF